MGLLTTQDESATRSESPTTAAANGSTLNPILAKLGMGNQPTFNITPGVGQNGAGKPAYPSSYAAGSVKTKADGSPLNDVEGLVNGSNFGEDTPATRQWAIDHLNANILSPTHLLTGQRSLDDTTQGLITDQLVRAGESNEGVTQRLMQGTDGAQQALGSKEGMLNHTTALGGGNAATDTLASALDRKNHESFNTSLEGLKRNAAFMAPQIQANRLKQVSGELNENEQLKLKNYQEQKDYIQKKQQMDLQLSLAKQQGRASAIGAVLGVAGTAVGAYYGGPAGAAAGGAAGTAVGNAAGSKT